MRLRALRDFVRLKIDQMCVFLKNQRPAEVSSAFSVTPESPTLE